MLNINFLSTLLPIKSEGTFPLQNLPVGLPPTKSLPYGGKLHLVTVLKLLLLPVSRIESPNEKSAGIVLFSGSFTLALMVQKNRKT
jgi:hypothetical protein